MGIVGPTHPTPSLHNCRAKEVVDPPQFPTIPWVGDMLLFSFRLSSAKLPHRLPQQNWGVCWIHARRRNHSGRGFALRSLMISTKRQDDATRQLQALAIDSGRLVEGNRFGLCRYLRPAYEHISNSPLIVACWSRRKVCRPRVGPTSNMTRTPERAANQMCACEWQFFASGAAGSIGSTTWAREINILGKVIEKKMKLVICRLCTSCQRPANVYAIESTMDPKALGWGTNTDLYHASEDCDKKCLRIPHAPRIRGGQCSRKRVQNCARTSDSRVRRRVLGSYFKIQPGLEVTRVGVAGVACTESVPYRRYQFAVVWGGDGHKTSDCAIGGGSGARHSRSLCACPLNGRLDVARQR
nr:hypothetical protein CFP56_57947 [Quercus suber]